MSQWQDTSIKLKDRQNIMSSWLRQGCIFSLKADQFFIGWGECRRSSKQPSVGPYIYAPDFYLEDREVYYSYEKTTYVNLSELKEWLRSVASSGLDLSWKSPQKQQFSAVFDRIQTDIQSRNIKKAVPVVFEISEASITSEHKAHMLSAAIETKSAEQFIYGFWSETDEGILGLTPEILFRSEDHQLTTMALAGTRPAKLAAELLHDQKEMNEHQIVIDDLRQQLQSFGDVIVGKTQAEIFGIIAHLKTEINLESKKIEFDQVVKNLHPTPALGVMPRQDLSALKFLECDHPRSRFGAPIAIIHQGLSLALVAIRNIQWKSGQVYLGSGCGVVTESLLDKEWDELSLKRATVKKHLGL